MALPKTIEYLSLIEQPIKTSKEIHTVDSQKFQQLKVLNLDGVEAKFFIPPSIRELRLKNIDSDSIKIVSNLKNLQKLTLIRFRGQGDHITRFFQQIVNSGGAPIKVLRLWHVDVTNETIKVLSKFPIKVLSLKGASITKERLESLSFKTLKELALPRGWRLEEWLKQKVKTINKEIRIIRRRLSSRFLILPKKVKVRKVD